MRVLTSLHCKEVLNTEVGGKAKGLAWLTLNGFNTPDWCVLPAETVCKILGDSLTLKIESILTQTTLENIETSVIDVSSLISEVKIKEATLMEISNWIKANDLEREKFAVRSSLVGEDGKDFSFAGQLETDLNVSYNEISSSILNCIKSAFSKRVLFYKLVNGISFEKHLMSVIIQKMIFPEKSGVCFTMNPDTGNQNEVYISTSFGDCDGVVSGMSDCDTYVINKKTGELRKDISNKKRYSSLKTNEKEKELSPSLGMTEVLTLQDLEQLKKEVLDLEDKKNSSQDIEWALADKLYFLQVRPVTLKEARSTSSHSFVFDNSNIQESYCGVTSPLTFSLASECYRLAYNQLMRFLNFSENEVSEQDFRHSNMLSYVEGRVYYNINSWYEGLKFMPSFGRSKADMEKMMGVEEPVEFVTDIELTGFEKLKKTPAMIGILYKLIRSFSKIDKTVETFNKDFWSLYRGYQENLKKELELKDLLLLHKSIKTEFLENWAAPLVNDFFVMVYNGKVSKVLEKIDRLEDLAVLTSGEDIDSIKPTLEIIRIAGLIKREKLEYLLELSSVDEVKEQNLKLGTELEAFVDLYGDRCIGELKLETLSYKQSPQKLFKLIKNYTTLENNQKKKPESEKNKEDQIKRLIKDETGFFSSIKFSKDLKKLKKGIRYRENMRLHRTRVVGLFREIYRKIGLEFEKTNTLDSKDDIFYLSHDEIENYVFAKSINKSLKVLVGLRKDEQKSYKEKEPKHHFVGSFPFNESVEFIEDESLLTEGELSGLGCYPGKVKAPVVVLTEPDETVPLKGKILCAMRTDPGWAPLFPQVSGLLVERGSSLSHSAVVAREMGIPTIVGVPGITKKIKTGDVVEFDGKSGKITKVKENQIGDECGA